MTNDEFFRTYIGSGISVGIFIRYANFFSFLTNFALFIHILFINITITIDFRHLFKAEFDC